MANVPLYFPFVFLALSCLLILLGMGAGGWVLAKVRGQPSEPGDTQDHSSERA